MDAPIKEEHNNPPRGRSSRDANASLTTRSTRSVSAPPAPTDKLKVRSHAVTIATHGSTIVNDSTNWPVCLEFAVGAGDGKVPPHLRATPGSPPPQGDCLLTTAQDRAAATVPLPKVSAAHVAQLGRYAYLHAFAARTHLVYRINPAQVLGVLDTHEAVYMACILGGSPRMQSWNGKPGVFLATYPGGKKYLVEHRPDLLKTNGAGGAQEGGHGGGSSGPDGDSDGPGDDKGKDGPGKPDDEGEGSTGKPDDSGEGSAGKPDETEHQQGGSATGGGNGDDGNTVHTAAGPNNALAQASGPAVTHAQSGSPPQTHSPYHMYPTANATISVGPGGSVIVHDQPHMAYPKATISVGPDGSVIVNDDFQTHNSYATISVGLNRSVTVNNNGNISNSDGAPNVGFHGLSAYATAPNGGFHGLPAQASGFQTGYSVHSSSTAQSIYQHHPATTHVQGGGAAGPAIHFTAPVTPQNSSSGGASSHHGGSIIIASSPTPAHGSSRKAKGMPSSSKTKTPSRRALTKTPARSAVKKTPTSKTKSAAATPATTPGSTGSPINYDTPSYRFIAQEVALKHASHSPSFQFGEVYAHIMSTYPASLFASKTWKSGVRHAVMKHFVKVEPDDAPDKVNVWYRPDMENLLDEEEGMRPTRKRLLVGKRKRDGEAGEVLGVGGGGEKAVKAAKAVKIEVIDEKMGGGFVLPPIVGGD